MYDKILDTKWQVEIDFDEDETHTSRPCARSAATARP
jgi:hypothetical protein